MLKEQVYQEWPDKLWIMQVAAENVMRKEQTPCDGNKDPTA